MQSIDFLPDEYRRQNLRRRGHPWRTATVAASLGLIAATAAGQYRSCNRLQGELAAVAPQCRLVADRKTELAQLQGQLDEARTEAELITYLRHPWPRTKLLEELLAPLPEEVTLQEIQIESAVSARAASSEPPASAGQQQAKAMPPAVQALTMLRNECDSRQTVVTVAGLASGNGPLHAYLAKLGQGQLFVKANLRAIETQKTDQGEQMRFQASVAVRPGFGQAGGPAEESRGNDGPELGVRSSEEAQSTPNS